MAARTMAWGTAPASQLHLMLTLGNSNMALEQGCPGELINENQLVHRTQHLSESIESIIRSDQVSK